MARQINKLAILGLVLGLGVFAACSSSDDNGTPTINTGGTGGGTAGSSSNAGSGGKNSTGGGGGTKANGGTGGKIDVGPGGAGGEAGATTETCTGGPADCFCGQPKAPADFLNQCTANSCIKFDNAAHNIPSPLPTL